MIQGLLVCAYMFYRCVADMDNEGNPSDQDQFWWIFHTKEFFNMDNIHCMTANTDMSISLD